MYNLSEWVSLSDVVKVLSEEFGKAPDHSRRVLVQACWDDAITSRGRVFNAVVGPSFRINPAAWSGMYVDFALSKLLPPDPVRVPGPFGSEGTTAPGEIRVVTAGINSDQTPFTHSPIIHDVRLFWGDVLAWVNATARPLLPALPKAPDRVGPVAYGNPLPLWTSAFEGHDVYEGENSERSAQPLPVLNNFPDWFQTVSGPPAPPLPLAPELEAFEPPVSVSDVPNDIANNSKPPKRKPGRKPDKRTAVKNAMRDAIKNGRTTAARLSKDKDLVLIAMYGVAGNAKRGVCVQARNKILSELGYISDS